MVAIDRIKYSDLVDAPKLQALMASLRQVIGGANAVLDVEGIVIANSGWQEACTGFHRVNPETCRRCIESDTSLAENVTRGVPFAIYRCHNGLVDAAAPIIVDGQHVANVFTGQFLTAPPDTDFFRSQARQFGFDETSYLEAISRVPVLPLERVESVTRLYAQLAGILADNGMDRLKEARTTQEIKRSQQELRALAKAANEALEAERRRTARELHDELGQSLTALKIELASLRSAFPPGQPELGERALAMNALLDGTIAATRRIASDLRPLMLDDLGLAAALDWLTHNFSKRTGIATDLVVDDAVAQVPEPIASALYRITQESLTNVTKYAQATTTEIRLERDDDWVQLTVRDNGRGIEEADQSKRGAFGLLGIRERVMLLSGEIAIKGEPGRGSEVRVRIPLAAAETL